MSRTETGSLVPSDLNPLEERRYPVCLEARLESLRRDLGQGDLEVGVKSAGVLVWSGSGLPVEVLSPTTSTSSPLEHFGPGVFDCEKRCYVGS